MEKDIRTEITGVVDIENLDEEKKPELDSETLKIKRQLLKMMPYTERAKYLFDDE